MKFAKAGLVGAAVVAGALLLILKPPAATPPSSPAAAPKPPPPLKTLEMLTQEAVALNLPKPPPLNSPPEDLAAYFALLDKIAPGNPAAVQAATEARRVYKDAERRQKAAEHKAAAEKERAGKKDEREKFRAKKAAEHPPRDPQAVPGPPLFPPPVLPPPTSGVEKPDLPQPPPPKK